jgi:hypothetical protein
MDDSLSKLVPRIAESRISTAREMWRRRADQPWLVRLAKVALYKTLDRLAFDLFVSHFSEGGYHYLGNGWQQLVLRSRNGDHVLKIAIRTICRSEAEARQTAVTYQALSDTCQRYLGRHWTDSTFRAVRLPFFERYAVAATQPLLHPVKSFASVEDLLAHRHDAAYREELRSLFQRIDALRSETALCPDLLPAWNVVLIEEPTGATSVRIVDTLPKTPTQLPGLPGPDSRTSAKLAAVVDSCKALLDG